MRISIAIRFALIVLAGCVVLGTVLGGAAIWRNLTSSETAAQAQLKAVADARRDALNSYLSTINEDMSLVSSNPVTVEALEAFDTAWRALPGQPETRLQALYVDGSPYPVGERDNLADAGDGSAYSQVHAARHPWFLNFQRTRGYYDVFLFNTRGDLVYSVFKEADYATNMLSGPYADTDLANAFRAGLSAAPGDVAFFDFRPYAPSNDAPASFVSTPVVNAQGQTIGVLSFQMPIDRMNAVMSAETGLGETGDAYLIGLDGVMRTEPRFGRGNSILQVRTPSEFLATAMADTGEVILADDWRGERVLAIGESLEFHGVRLGVITTLSAQEAYAAARRVMVELIGLALIVTGVVGAAGFWAANKAARPIGEIAALPKQMANGDLQFSVPYKSRPDEVGDLAIALDEFRLGAIRQQELEADQAEAEARSAQVLRDERITLANRFEQSVGGIVGSVSSAAEQLSLAAQRLSSASEQTAGQSIAVAAAAEEATVNVETVASAAEEMSASVSEIRRQSSQSAQSADSAAEEAQKTVAKVEKLSEAANTIGDVVTLIQSIAEQTNLLALNATIEAARAGEAGKGFAIVAQEVKALASQTASATSDIAEQITAIQAATADSASAIGSVAGVISELSATSSSISAAVEEQSGATAEIAMNVQEAATGTRNVTSSITTVNEAANESSQSANDVLSASQALSEQAEQLQEQVSEFLSTIRAA